MPAMLQEVSYLAFPQYHLVAGSWNPFCASAFLTCCDLLADGQCHLSSAQGLAWQSSLCLASLAKSIRKHYAKLPAYHPPNYGAVAWLPIQGYPYAAWKNIQEHRSAMWASGLFIYLTKKGQQVPPEEAKITYVGNLSSPWILEGSCSSKAVQN